MLAEPIFLIYCDLEGSLLPFILGAMQIIEEWNQTVWKQT